MSVEGLVEHFFRHEYGRLVAALCRRVGVPRIDDVEDAVQSALMAAIEFWPAGGRPDNPSAWLFRAASNALMGKLRQRNRRDRLLAEHAAEVAGPETPAAWDPDATMPDDLLRMLFVCCDGAIPAPSQLVLALKTLCGFDVREIASRLFTTEANVYKRLERARARLRGLPLRTAEPSTEEIAVRLPAVRQILHLLFTEGYLSSHATLAIRRELCEEAIRLATILADHPLGSGPETSALLALMHLHAARMTARQDEAGGLLLLEEQDRSRWDQHGIAVGLRWLAKSAEGEVFTRFHAEAGIAAEHCLAASIRETRWDRIVECYLLLEQAAPSPMHTLNRAVAVAEWKGPAEGLVVLQGLELPATHAGSYMLAAVASDLHRRCGNPRVAAEYAEEATRAAPTAAVRRALERRLRVGVG